MPVIGDWNYDRYLGERHSGAEVIPVGTIFRWRRLNDEVRERIARQSRESGFYYPAYWEIQRKRPDGTWTESIPVMELPGMD